jgi:hypothetical protein
MKPKTRKVLALALILVGAFLLARGIEYGLTTVPALDGTLEGVGEGDAAGAITATIVLSAAGVGSIIYGLRIIKKAQRAPQTT